MKAAAHNFLFLRLVGMVVACWALPPLLLHALGLAVGTLAALGAGAFWYSQYRIPAWKKEGHSSFWFVVVGYGVIGLTLLACLGRLLR